jgi:signal peptidase II
MRKLSLTGVPWLWLSILVLLVDQLSKIIALKNLSAYEPVRQFAYFNFTLAYNKGAAFSFLRDASGWQTWLFGSISVVVSAMIVIWLYRSGYKQRWLSCALALIVGGALGNLLDRILYGYVIDFLDFHYHQLHFPTFNLADSAICVGAFMLFVDVFFKSK